TYLSNTAIYPLSLHDALPIWLLTLFYVFPLFNFRSLSGVKIYIVALCWVIFTLLLPVFQAGFEVNSDVFLKCMQRFLLVIILIRSEEHTSELQSRENLVCRLL